MTLSTTDSRFSYDGDGSITAFAYPRKVIEAAHLKVYLYDEDDDSMSLQTLNTHYTFAGSGLSNGIYASATVTFVTAPGVDKKVIIFRDPALTQESDFTAESNVLTLLNRFADRVEMKFQRMQDQLDRAIRLPDGDYASTWGNATAKADYASALLGFNSSGAPIPSSGASGVAISAAMTPVVQALSVLIGLSLQLLNVRVFVLDYYIAIAGNDTDGIQAASAALQAAGGGVLAGTPGKTYNPYPNATDTAVLGAFSGIRGVHLWFPGCTFNIARTFTGSQTQTCWQFDDCSDVSWTGHKVVSETEPYNETYLRGISWMVFTGAGGGVGGGRIEQTGGVNGVAFVRVPPDADRMRGIDIDIKTSFVAYPVSFQNSGDDARVQLDSEAAYRSYFAYGVEDHQFYVRSKDAVSNNLLLCANYTADTSAAALRNMKGVYHLLPPSGANGAGANDIALMIRNTLPGVIEGVHIDVQIEQGGTHNHPLLFYVAKTTNDTNTIDSTGARGHRVADLRISGTALNQPTGEAFNLFEGTYGNWTGETCEAALDGLSIQGNTGATARIAHTPLAKPLSASDFRFSGTITHSGTFANDVALTVDATTTPPTLGTGGSATAIVTRLSANRIRVNGTVQFGSAGVAAGSGVYLIKLPSPYATKVGRRTVSGSAVLSDASAGANYAASCIWSAGVDYIIACATGGMVAHNVPYTWAENDAINFSIEQELTTL